MKAWWNETAWPAIRRWTVALWHEWWADIGERPRPHFVSAVMGMALYFAIKFAVWLAA